MAWTTPRTWVATEIVTAALMNTHVRDNLAELRAGGLALTSQAAGDLLYASGTTALARLAKGANYTVLTNNGTVPQWSNVLTLTGGAGAAALTVAATGRIYLDGGGNTYINESSADVVDFVIGGSTRLTLNATNVVAVGGFYMTTWPTTATPANATVANGDHVYIVTSLRSAKQDIVAIPLHEAQRVVLGLQAVTYRSRVDTNQRQWPGFIAEDVEAVTPTLATYGAQGDLQALAYDRVPAYLVPVAQDHERRIAALEARLA